MEGAGATGIKFDNVERGLTVCGFESDETVVSQFNVPNARRLWRRRWG